MTIVLRENTTVITIMKVPDALPINREIIVSLRESSARRKSSKLILRPTKRHPLMTTGT